MRLSIHCLSGLQKSIYPVNEKKLGIKNLGPSWSNEIKNGKKDLLQSIFNFMVKKQILFLRMFVTYLRLLTNIGLGRCGLGIKIIFSPVRFEPARVCVGWLEWPLDNPDHFTLFAINWHTSFGYFSKKLVDENWNKIHEKEQIVGDENIDSVLSKKNSLSFLQLSFRLFIAPLPPWIFLKGDVLVVFHQKIILLKNQATTNYNMLSNILKIFFLAAWIVNLAQCQYLSDDIGCEWDFF